MAITNIQVITDALRLINVISEIDTPSAEQGSHALRRLNQMIAQWEVDTVKFGYFAQSSTTDTCPIPDWAERGVTGQLALDLCPTYGASISAEGAKLADEGWTTILRTAMNLKLRPSDLTHLGGNSYLYDITTGTYG